MAEKHNPCNECTIRKTTIFSILNEIELSSIGKLIETLTVKKKGTVFFENDSMTDIYLVKNGIIKVYKSLQDGRQQILRLCGLGEILGLDAIFLKRYLTTAKAVTESTICKIHKKDFLDFISTKQKLSLKLLQATSEELAFSQNQIFNLGTRTAKERIADFLLYVYNSQCDCKVNPKKINLCISRQEISELLGIKQETVVRILTQLRIANLIQIQGRDITLLNPAALSKLALHSELVS
jgi:CRP-like cAMP-binding protein